MKFQVTTLFLVFIFCVTQQCLSQAFVYYYNEGIDAYKKDDYTGFLKAFQKADSLRPNHPVLLYNLAAGYALTGQTNQALNTLEYRIRFYASKDFLEDDDFKTLSDLPGWNILKQKIQEYNAPKQTSSPAFQFDFEGFHPEGITFNTSTSRFLISDIRNGLIYSFNKNGNDKELVLDLKEYGYWSAMGLAFDLTNPDKLWLTTAALPNFSDYDEELEGKSAVLCFDLNSGKLLQSFSVEGNHVFGDLIIADNGTVYVTDSLQPIVYQIDQDDSSLTEFVRQKEWWNLQGLALSDDKQTLYVADHITGVYRVDLRSKQINPLISENERLRGGDGLYLVNNHLILLQNGTVPKRVASIKLDEERSGITNTLQFSDQALSDLNEPTLGVFVDNALYYIANSPWPYYDSEQKPKLNIWPTLKIFKLDMTNPLK